MFLKVKTLKNKKHKRHVLLEKNEEHKKSFYDYEFGCISLRWQMCKVVAGVRRADVLDSQNYNRVDSRWTRVVGTGHNFD